MRITTWAEYGVICALHLARRANDGPVTGRDIAAQERLPADYVEQILLRLRRADVIKSVRGARGGYMLARPSTEITIRDVIHASELETFDPEMPIVVDLDGFTYTRQERDGLLLGLYERHPRHWQIDGAPWDFGMELLPPDVDRILPELSKGLERFPALQRVGIRRWVNGAFTFSPDGNPLVGPVGPRGYWVACAVMAYELLNQKRAGK